MTKKKIPDGGGFVSLLHLHWFFLSLLRRGGGAMVGGRVFSIKYWGLWEFFVRWVGDKVLRLYVCHIQCVEGEEQKGSDRNRSGKRAPRRGGRGWEIKEKRK